MQRRVTLGMAFLAAGFLCGNVRADEAFDQANQAYLVGNYAKVIELLKPEAQREPQNGDVHLLLTKSYYELQDRDAAVESAEKAVASNPKSSVYHEWLGRTYGEKADKASWFSALSLAKKARKEFETAVQLDEKNYSAMQALIEFDCSAPSIAGGGEDKAKVEIQKIAALDAAEGHYAAGNCRRQKKDFAVADAEFTKALESNPKSVDLVYDIGDYAMKQGQADRLLAVANTGQKLNLKDPRGRFYYAVAFILRKEKLADAESMIRDYLQNAPKRNNYPSPAFAHYWLGQIYEQKNQTDAALKEYQTAAQLEPKNRYINDALKRLKKS